MREALATVWANPYVRVAAGIAVVGLLVVAFVAAQPAGSLFLTALGLAYLPNPVVDWLQARGVHRRLSVAWVAEPLATLADLLRQAARALAPYLERIGAGVYEVVSGTVAGVAFFLVVLVLTVYVLHDYHRFAASLLDAWPRPYQATVRAVARSFDRAVGGYVRGQVVIAVAVGGMVYVGLAIVGLPFAGVIGLLAGLLNVIPYLGTIVPVIPAWVVALAGGWWQVVFVVANQIDNHVLTPLVLSRSTRLHPVTVIVAIIGGFAFAGLVAAIFAVPVVAFAKAVYAEHYLESRFYREG
jgi:predicted PurR-regulated permease PerM